MTMHPQVISLIPRETERVAHAAFPKGSPIMRIRDELGMRLRDQDFAALFPTVGQLAMRPSRLMLVTSFPFLEGLGDRQATDAARRCIDWKDALALNLSRRLAWWAQRPQAQTRQARFTAALNHAAEQPLCAA